MYEILDQDSSTKVVRTKRIDVYARKIEEYEGRKRVSIKTEITDGQCHIATSVNVLFKSNIFCFRGQEERS